MGDTLNPPECDVGGDDACGMLCVAVSESLCMVRMENGTYLSGLGIAVPTVFCGATPALESA